MPVRPPSVLKKEVLANHGASSLPKLIGFPNPNVLELILAFCLKTWFSRWYKLCEVPPLPLHLRVLGCMSSFKKIGTTLCVCGRQWGFPLPHYVAGILTYDKADKEKLGKETVHDIPHVRCNSLKSEKTFSESASSRFHIGGRLRGGAIISLWYVP